MPTLEIINERFARLFRIGLFNFLRRSAEVRSVRCGVQVQRIHPQPGGADRTWCT
jgi:flagellar motor switch protein FliM